MTTKWHLILCLFMLACSPMQGQVTATKFIKFDDTFIQYMGRIGMTDSCAEIYWSGSSLSLTVKATPSVKVLLSDVKGNSYFFVIIDDDSTTAVKIKIDSTKKFYILADSLDGKAHKIELFKVTNTDFNTTRFYGVEVAESAKIVKPQRKSKRKIEFFGNSITCGHGVEDSSKNSGAAQFFNNYRAYGAITARHFKAQYHCTAKSGIGIMVSWFQETMPDIYDRLNPKDPLSTWDFSRYTPDIVVVNLFQNDSWIVNMPDNEQFKARFGTTKPTEDSIIIAYKNFIQTLRGKYPKAHIICALGNMDATKTGSKWTGYIDSAVALLNDKRIVTHFFPYKNSSGHPVRTEQAAMAKDLITFIEQQKYWKKRWWFF
jgi:hypothetical protein